MSLPKLKSKLELHGAAATSSPHSLVYLPSSSKSNNNSSSNKNENENEDKSILYASNCIINIAKPIRDDEEERREEGKNDKGGDGGDDGGNGNGEDDENDQNDANDVLYNVNKTLRTCTIPRQKDCMMRSITTMKLLTPVTTLPATSTASKMNINIVACAYSDGTLTLWKQVKNETSNYNRDKDDDDDDDCCCWEEEVIVGTTVGDEGETILHGPQDGESERLDFDSITDVDGVYKILLESKSESESGAIQMKIQAIILTSSSVGVKCYKYETTSSSTSSASASAPASAPAPVSSAEGQKQIQTSYAKVATYPTSSIKVTKGMKDQNQIILAVGTAMPRHNRIHFYTLCNENMNINENANGKGGWKHQGSLLGHLGWVTCLDWLKDYNNDDGGGGGEHMMLASGSHDARIRLWKFHPGVVCNEEDVIVATEGGVGGGESSRGEDDQGDHDDDDENDDGDDLVEEGEARMYIRYKTNDGTMMESAVTLEALLIGHEESVTAVSWRPMSNTPCLISSSMDRSILIWMEENDYTTSDTTTATIEGVGNVWAPVTRVGTAGGILGGSVGSSLLGFVNVMWNGNGSEIIGHGYGGAIYFWSRRGNNEIDRWRANPCITGHFRGCNDISWEVSEGLYLLSAGLDQTCRLWTHLPLPTKSRIWREVGRPQVHGYDLNTVACIGDGNTEMKHRFVSGADEKEARSFDAPISTVKLLNLIHGRVNQDGVDKNRIERAFIPSLGLSNRATADDAMEEDSYGNTAQDNLILNSSDIKPTKISLNSVKKMLSILPHERDLGVTSLWPEIRKLYGHQTELVCLATNAGQCGGEGDKVFLASSCKARDAENASIRMWDVERNMCLDVLKDGHKSTVTSLSFSSDGRFLASSGKDRRLCLWRRCDTNEGTKFVLALLVESAHKRIVWSLDFCPSDPSLLCTGSRDGYLKLWRIADGDDGQLSIKELHRWEPSNKTSKKVEPITAIAFAPLSLQLSSILAVGLESGLLEVWAVPLDVNGSTISCSLMHSIPATSCHIGSVKKLAWKPVIKSSTSDGNKWECTLASCGTDHGVRIYRMNEVN